MPSPVSFGLILRVGACFVTGGALVSVGCSGAEDESLFAHEAEGGDDGAGASGGSKGGRGGSEQGGHSSGGDDGVSGGGSGLAGNGNTACDLADLESCGASDDLCCPGPSGGECVPSSLQNCGACHAMCDPAAADACVDRACVCGSEPPCSGDAPFCHEGHCAECRNDTDCADSPAGNQCVTGVCSACDPEDDSGCTAQAAFCDTDLHCKGCLDHNDCASGKVCSGNECINCTSDSDCLDNPAGPECVSDSCRECDPTGNAGCSGERDTCHKGSFVCVECMNGSQCAPGQGCVNFDCTECSSDADCAGNASGAQCVEVTPGNSECKPCDPLDDGGCTPPATCTAGFVCAN